LEGQEKNRSQKPNPDHRAKPICFDMVEIDKRGAQKSPQNAAGAISQIRPRPDPFPQLLAIHPATPPKMKIQINLEKSAVSYIKDLLYPGMEHQIAGLSPDRFE
jgi:hypothetical protein